MGKRQATRQELFPTVPFGGSRRLGHMSGLPTNQPSGLLNAAQSSVGDINRPVADSDCNDLESEKSVTRRRLQQMPMPAPTSLAVAGARRPVFGFTGIGLVGVDSLPVGSCRIQMLRANMSESKTDVPYGTLDLLILKTLDTMGPMHGYRIARRIEQVAENAFRLNQGSIYPALIRLEQQGWIRTQWGISETKRKVKFYSVTRAGLKQLSIEVTNWERATALVARFLGAQS